GGGSARGAGAPRADRLLLSRVGGNGERPACDGAARRRGLPGGHAGERGFPGGVLLPLPGGQPGVGHPTARHRLLGRGGSVLVVLSPRGTPGRGRDGRRALTAAYTDGMLNRLKEAAGRLFGRAGLVPHRHPPYVTRDWRWRFRPHKEAATILGPALAGLTPWSATNEPAPPDGELAQIFLA